MASKITCGALAKNKGTNNIVLHTPSKITYHKYAGCIWPTEDIVESFLDGIKKCKLDGGQLITLEYFPNEKEFNIFHSRNVVQSRFIKKR
ncbi:hypothetical protein Avbf_18898 [Armadillidium vulgare]|nr:hypothetical protein Avbf_18898 [Armadillidium vulgare]